MAIIERNRDIAKIMVGGVIELERVVEFVDEATGAVRGESRPFGDSINPGDFPRADLYGLTAIATAAWTPAILEGWRAKEAAKALADALAELPARRRSLQIAQASGDEAKISQSLANLIGSLVLAQVVTQEQADAEGFDPVATYEAWLASQA